jgi:hypothetical protein
MLTLTFAAFEKLGITTAFLCSGFRSIPNMVVILLVLLFVFSLFVNGQVLVADNKSEYLGSGEFNAWLSLSAFLGYVLCAEFGWKVGLNNKLSTIIGVIIALVATNLFEGRSLFYTFFGSYLVWRTYVYGAQKFKRPIIFIIGFVVIGSIASMILRVIRYVPLTNIFSMDLNNIFESLNFKGSESAIYTYYFAAVDYVVGGVFRPQADTLVRFFLLIFPSSIFEFKPTDVTYKLSAMLCNSGIVCARSVPAMLYGESILNFGIIGFFAFPIFLGAIIVLMTRMIVYSQFKFMLGAFAVCIMFMARGWFDGGFISFFLMFLLSVLLKVIFVKNRE